MLQVLLGLRAIGNAGHMASSASLVNKCLTRNKNPMEVRVAAAQAFRRLPCDANVSLHTHPLYCLIFSGTHSSTLLSDLFWDTLIHITV